MLVNLTILPQSYIASGPAIKLKAWVITSFLHLTPTDFNAIFNDLFLKYSKQRILHLILLLVLFQILLLHNVRFLVHEMHDQIKHHYFYSYRIN